MSATRIVYLDHAAATPVDPLVLSVMQPYFSAQFYNPSATYTPARSVAAALREARGKVAICLGAKLSDIIFTAGGSEANNLAIHGVMRQQPGKNIVVSAIEHDSVLEAARHYEHRIVPVDERGMIDLEQLDQAIDDNTALVSVMYANNELGTIQPIRQISQLVKEKRGARRHHDTPLLLHTDAAQAPNYLDVHVARLGVDMLSLNGGKIYGPKQSGVLYLKGGIRLEPLIDGGGQEMGLRSGTENVAGAVGFAEALAQAQARRHDEVARLQLLQRHLTKGISRVSPDAQFNGSKTKLLPNFVHVSFPGVDNERLLVQLDEAGIMAAAGSACSASSETPSHVLAAIGLDDQTAQSSVRFSLGRMTDEADIAYVIDTLARVLT